MPMFQKKLLKIDILVSYHLIVISSIPCKLSRYPVHHLIDIDQACKMRTLFFFILYCIHTEKLSCLGSGVEFNMNDIFYEFKCLHHF